MTERAAGGGGPSCKTKWHPDRQLGLESAGPGPGPSQCAYELSVASSTTTARITPGESTSTQFTSHMEGIWSGGMVTPPRSFPPVLSVLPKSFGLSPSIWWGILCLQSMGWLYTPVVITWSEAWFC